MAEYLLDTNHLSPLVTLEHPLRIKILAALQTDATFSIAVPSLAEFLLGMSLIPRATQNKREWQYLENYFNYRSLDKDDAKQAAELSLSLRKQGWQLAMLDSFIAVVALRYDLILLTTDKDFRAVPNLRYENWRI